jgi:hypothetical protein
VHKTANVLDKMPKSIQGKAKQLIHEMYLAPTRKAALAAYDQFMGRWARQVDVGEVRRALLRVDVTNAGRLHTARRPMNLIPLALWSLGPSACGPLAFWACWILSHTFPIGARYPYSFWGAFRIA